MSTPITGVYPCYENQFQINAAASGVEKKMVDIADCETFSVSFDNGVEEWHPFTEKGWVRRLLTSKGVTISVTAKRNVGDVQWTFPDGTVVLFAGAVVNVKNIGAGDSTAVAPLEFDIMSNGKPEITPAA